MNLLIKTWERKRHYWEHLMLPSALVSWSFYPSIQLIHHLDKVCFFWFYSDHKYHVKKFSVCIIEWMELAVLDLSFQPELNFKWPRYLLFYFSTSNYKFALLTLVQAGHFYIVDMFSSTWANYHPMDSACTSANSNTSISWFDRWICKSVCHIIVLAASMCV